jgi:hypothetical protein
VHSLPEADGKFGHPGTNGSKCLKPVNGIMLFLFFLTRSALFDEVGLFLLVLSLCGFSSSMSGRILDPVVTDGVGG